MTTCLLVSLSGIRNTTLDHCAAFIADMDARRVPVSLLVVPRDPGGSTTVHWLRERRNRGDAILMHGYDHTVDPLGPWGPYAVARVGRRAEFAALPAHEAGLRLHAANLLLERLDLRTDAFAPPRWLVSADTLATLRRRGWRVCATATEVHALHTNQVYRGRVLGYPLAGLAPSVGTEPWWCRALVLGATRTARRGGLVRIAVDARDLTGGSARRSALLDAIDAALHYRARAGTYSTLVDTPKAVPPSPRAA